MDTPLLPAPIEPQGPHADPSAGAQDDVGGGHEHEEASGTGPSAYRPPTREEICRQIGQLNGLVLMGLVEPAKANVVQRGLKILLDAEGRQAEATEAGAAPEGLVEACRKEPGMVDLLEPFLSDEQMRWLVGELTQTPQEASDADRQV
jgi:hypothetical protein